MISSIVRRFRFTVALLGLAVLFVGRTPSRGQDGPRPRLDVIYPPGGQSGATTDVRVAGSALDGITAIRFTDPRVTSEPLGGQRFRITIPKDVPPGILDARAVCGTGLSSVLGFFVTPLPCVVEPDPQGSGTGIRKTPMNVSVSGAIQAAGDVDAYRFEAKAGTRVVIDCWAERLDSALRATLMLEDGQGKRLASSRGYSDLDPLIDYRIPRDGEYVVRIHDLTYTGSPRHFYRLDIDGGPRVEFAMPPAVEAGKTTKVTLFGRNLTKNGDSKGLEFDRVEFEATPPPLGSPRVARDFRRVPRFEVETFPLDLPNSPTPVALGVVDVPVVLDANDNHHPKTAQRIEWPCEVGGGLTSGNEADWYRFRANRGDVFWIDVFAERIGSPADPDLFILDARGERELFKLGDSLENRGVGGVVTSHRDPSGRWTAPANGDYLLLVKDVVGGLTRDDRRRYRLSLRREESDFELLAIPSGGSAPSTLNVPRGGRALLDVVVKRRRGMSASIRVSAEGLPNGLTCPDVWIGPDVDRVPLVLTASHESSAFSGTLNVVGRADLGGTEIVRRATGASIIEIGTPLPSARLTQEIPIAIGPPAACLVTAAATSTDVSQGSIIDVAIDIATPGYERTKPAAVTGLGSPALRTDRVVSIPADQTKGWVSLQVPSSLSPGSYTFALRVDLSVTIPGTNPNEKPREVAATGYSNPITIRVEPGAFDFWVDPANPPKIKRGQVIRLNYRAFRRNGFIGKINIRLAAPDGVRGLRARDEAFVGLTDSGSLQVVASDDAPLGKQPFLRLHGLGTVEDEPIHQVGYFLDLEITE